MECGYKMSNKEAYNLGQMVGERVKMGLRPLVIVLKLPLPRGIIPHSSQAMAYRLGYLDELRGRVTIIR